jgi:hypothetical protein
MASKLAEDLIEKLKNNARYTVEIRVSNPELLNNILNDIFVREYGLAYPGTKYTDDAASRFGIRHTFYKSSIHFINCPLSKKQIVDKHVSEASSIYLQKVKEQPIVIRRIKSEVKL